MDKAVEIEDDLIREAMEITGAASARRSMLDLVGEIRLNDDYDCKAVRAGDAAG